ncbi:hypothetical protein BO99DRAFT_470968 [Aspergillus violaceofuscus CBS 115571]|uniref:Uncharacterized protein n=1 Tax=Aspergillus violaceofuscus (strain CBS 115571) TaxID=1450538 RepID=A0A2V5IH16_ASPV1|nr:hypothetical protein BO99DRAFT_470968 [Aspergillus violaceofuscus CBS 115571]
MEPEASVDSMQDYNHPGVNIEQLVKDFLEKEGQSRMRQSHLELRLAEEISRAESEQLFRSQLQARLADTYFIYNQLHLYLTQVCQDLETSRKQHAAEKRRVLELESHMQTLSVLNNSLLKMLMPGSLGDFNHQDQIRGLSCEIYRQQCVINELQNIKLAHESTIQTLRYTIETTLGHIYTPPENSDEEREDERSSEGEDWGTGGDESISGMHLVPSLEGTEIYTVID